MTNRYRNSMVVRQWRILVALRQCPQTLEQLAERCQVTTRTIRRDLEALQAVPFPIFDVPGREGADRKQVTFGVCPAWPRHEVTPVTNLPEEIA